MNDKHEDVGEVESNFEQEESKKSIAATHSSDGRGHPSVMPGRFAGDGIRDTRRGGTMVLRPCHWCGKLCNFRRAGSRICPDCWRDRASIRVKQGVTR